MMRRLFAVLGSAVFLVIAPGTIAGLVPHWITRWRFGPPLFGWAGTRIAGAILIVPAALVLLDSFLRFALQGVGTPAPVFPTKHLVVTGLYRHVRNPMYVAVVAAIAGQGLMFGDVRVLEYGAAIWAAFHLFVIAYEEPTLRSAFGDEYAVFCAAVPRWIPRFAPWRS
jgi:protein-S-isoprenylcysteine O-methyltransferase Ste14